MSKSIIYVAARAGGRSDKTTVRTACDHFISTGGFCGGPTLAAEVANCAIERGWCVSIQDNRNGTITLHRATKLS